ncbi:serine/threonine-protein kinase pim-1 isoform X1 [Silurus meridionalis]|uniref:non-specific serine/threonine protein kinase n=1 Tax=Silurus meridionalis TaxID=175797 RepID=A0A8T0BR23_SILME|nr:hypothetical protein HF521_017890 [Silurus meridionalis]KAI5106457.1 serine/threonine-protein kinase pim-1 isoform X1 [Silurus meridionalis]
MSTDHEQTHTVAGRFPLFDSFSRVQGMTWKQELVRQQTTSKQKLVPGTNLAAHQTLCLIRLACEFKPIWPLGVHIRFKNECAVLFNWLHGMYCIRRCLPGTPSYAPPEWFNKKNYLAEPATVWSVGVTLYRLVCGSLPFKTRKELKHGHVRFSRSHSEECMHLIRWCLCTKPAGRPSLEQIEHHPWFHLKGSALQTTG